jgi:hypothetical protein
MKTRVLFAVIYTNILSPLSLARSYCEKYVDTKLTDVNIKTELENKYSTQNLCLSNVSATDTTLGHWACYGSR